MRRGHWLYGDILASSSDVYHRDGDDAWRALETMWEYNLPIEDQAKFLAAMRTAYTKSRRRRGSAAIVSPRSSAVTGGRPKRKSAPQCARKQRSAKASEIIGGRK
jgi:hypothetical protein